MTLNPPSILVHCDWGTAPEKRWMAKAVLTHGYWTAHPPEPVGPLFTLIDRVARWRGESSSAMVGFDFPIGIPQRYAANAGVDNFPSFLSRLGQCEWKHFYDLCLEASEISIHRPFYPYNFTPAGTRKRQHLIEGLRLNGFDDLLRRCEQPQKQRKIPAAGPLFWTLGAKAPGRGAIQGWKHVIAPSLQEKHIKLWPFNGTLDKLLQPGTTVVTETYPTQYHQSIFGSQIAGKGSIELRRGLASRFCRWAQDSSVTLTPGLKRVIESGFPKGKDDAFDAVIGLFGMIEAIQTWSSRHEPADPAIRNIEGWILGQSFA